MRLWGGLSFPASRLSGQLSSLRNCAQWQGEPIALSSIQLHPIRLLPSLGLYFASLLKHFHKSPLALQRVACTICSTEGTMSSVRPGWRYSGIPELDPNLFYERGLSREESPPGRRPVRVSVTASPIVPLRQPAFATRGVVFCTPSSRGCGGDPGGGVPARQAGGSCDVKHDSIGGSRPIAFLGCPRGHRIDSEPRWPQRTPGLSS